MLPPENLRIRPSRLGDLEVICEMIAGLAAYHDDAATLTPERLAELTLGPHPWVICLVATLQDEPVGYGALTPKVQLQYARKAMDLQHLFVIPQLRGQGVGAALIHAARQEAVHAGCEFLTVGTALGNDRAAALYRRAGFVDRPLSGPQFEMAL